MKILIFFIALTPTYYSFAKTKSCPAPLPAETYRTRCTGGKLRLTHNGQTKLYRDCIKSRSPARDMHPELISLIEKIRCELGDKLVVTSGYRSPRHNEYSWAFVTLATGNDKTVAIKSKHQIGKAVDFYVKGYSFEQTIELERKIHEWAGLLPSPLRGNREKVWTKSYPVEKGRDPDNLHDHPYIHVEWRE